MNKISSQKTTAFFFNKPIMKYSIIFAAIAIAVLICELFVFNFKWITSVFDKELSLKPVPGSGVNMTDDTLTFTSDSAVIEFNNINTELKYMCFKIDDKKDLKVSITVSAADEANENYFSAPQRTMFSSIKASQYIRLHFSGKVSDLKLNVSGMKGISVRASAIKLNTHVPLMFSIKRFILLTLILFLLVIIRPGSGVYKYKTNLKSGKQKCLALTLAIIQIAIFWNSIHINSQAIKWHESIDWHQQYYALTSALKEGHLYLDYDVSDELQNMENPYDPSARNKIGADFRWDTAYYNGKYYMYFGALPAILLYLPYNLVTGKNLPNYIAVFIFGIAVIIGIMLLLWEIIKKRYKNTPFAVYMILSVVFPWISVLAYASYKPDFYLVPPISAMVFSILGLYFWLSAENIKKNGDTRLISWRMALGSLFVAFTSACRPQFLLTIIPGILWFWDHAFKKRILFSKKGIKETTAVCLPFIIIAALVMSYNAARFGSPFDFGANYNLTTNDMTHRGFVPGRTGLGLFTYFVQPPHIDAVFPFLHDFGCSTVYQGLTLNENLMGGALMLYPILFIGIYGAFKRKLFADKLMHRTVCITIIMALFTAVMDTQMAGLLTRYYTDYVWLLMLAACITIFALYGTAENSAKTAKITSLTLGLSALTLVLAFLSIFAHSENSIQSANPELYYSLQHLIAFWM